MIKYLGSKRRLVPVIDHLAEATGAATALDLFTGTTRVAQAFKRRRGLVTAVDLARYAEVFARCYVETDADQVDRTELVDAWPIWGACRGEPGYVTETFCRASRFFQPFNGERIDAIRNAIEAEFSRSPLYPILLTSLIEAADRVDSTTGVQMAYVKQWAARSYRPTRAAAARAVRRPRPGRARRRPRSGAGPRTVRPRLPRPALQPAPVLHQLPRVGDLGGVGRARPLRGSVQADRRP